MPSSHDDTYTAEPAVQLRTQRLRRVDPHTPELTADTPDTGSAAASTAATPEEAASPYGVDQAYLDAVDDLDAPSGISAAPVDFDDAAATEPAAWGWRGRLNAGLGLRLAPKPDSTELNYRAAVAAVQRSLRGTKIVAVIGLKGGSGKTPTTITLSAIFGRHRGRGVVAWDSSESTGTLASRAARSGSDATVWDVLEHASDLCSPNAYSGKMGEFLQLQPTKDEILAGDSSTTRERGIDWHECQAIMAVLRRHRDLIFLDTGNDPLKGNWRWAIDHAHQIVVPVPLRPDAAQLAYRMLAGIVAAGHPELVASAIVLVVATPGSRRSLMERLDSELRSIGVDRILEVPYEPLFDSGQRISMEALSQATVEAYTHVAAAVADTLAAPAADPVYADAGYAAADSPVQMSRPAERDVRPSGPSRGQQSYCEQYQPEQYQPEPYSPEREASAYRPPPPTRDRWSEDHPTDSAPRPSWGRR